MAKSYIVDVERYDYTGRKRVIALIQFGGGNEFLNARDVGLQTVDSIMLSPQSIVPTAQPLPIGSVATVLGTPGPEGRYRGITYGSANASQIALRWATGSTGTRLATSKSFGTASAGTKSAFAFILGT